MVIMRGDLETPSHLTYWLINTENLGRRHIEIENNCLQIFEKLTYRKKRVIFFLLIHNVRPEQRNGRLESDCNFIYEIIS